MTESEWTSLKTLADTWHAQSKALIKAENRTTERADTLRACADTLERTLPAQPLPTAALAGVAVAPPGRGGTVATDHDKGQGMRELEMTRDRPAPKKKRR